MKTSSKKYAVICQYDSPYGKRNQVLSRHNNYESAQKNIKKMAPGESANWLAIRPIYEIED